MAVATVAPTTPSESDDQAIALDPAASAREAGLRYVSDDRPGIKRRRAGKGFRYVRPDGSPVKDEQTLRRIKGLVIPPAWTDVWIATDPRGHIQATGRDARGRKQYRYHARWRTVRDETKYERMVAFGEALPTIRARVDAELARPGLPREKVLATVVRLLEATLIRVGNEEYARENRSYGLTTMRQRHLKVNGSSLRFRFRGKSGKEHEISVRDRRLARLMRRLQELPGQELFQYLDEDGARRTVDSDDVNAYLREITGQEFSAKDFRTWAGTILCAVALRELDGCETETEVKRNIAQVVKVVSQQLGNTPAVCRSCYIHPAILETYAESRGESLLAEALGDRLEDAADDAPRDLTSDETAVLDLLRSRLTA
ncbi:MAG: DNA topoisomerase IB [Chloroflexota bacterium]